MFAPASLQVSRCRFFFGQPWKKCLPIYYLEGYGGFGQGGRNGVRNQLVGQARRLQFVRDWLDLRRAKLEDQKLQARYAADLNKRSGNESDRERIWSQYRPEYHLIWDPIYVRQTNKLVARAHEHGVRVPPLPRDGLGDDNWEWSSAGMGWFLRGDAEDRLKREIRLGMRQDEDEFRRRATLFLSVAAFVLALVSLLKKEKQPDPCPRNYYRNDAGECVFALQKSTPSRLQSQRSPIE